MVLRQLLPLLRRCTQVHLGDGSTVSFWHDNWIGPLPLRDIFPAFFSHADHLHITVADNFSE
jgi:hypothetical protein